MRRLSILAATLALTSLLFIVTGCSKDSAPINTYVEPSQEELEVQAFLEASEYALPIEFQSDEEYEGETMLEGVGELSEVTEDENETILPWVRFVRIAKAQPRIEYTIQIPGADGEGTADVRITCYVTGTFVVDNTRDGIQNPFYRPFDSVSVRNVVLRRTPDGWVLEKISPVDIISTNDGGTTIEIAGMRARSSSSLYPEITLASPDTLLELSELPSYAPGDTILIAARAYSMAEDGCWLFLHVHCALSGVHLRTLHWRVPFIRDASDPSLYYARWILPLDAGAPRVFHMAVDGIGWNTLFGDESAVYNSKMWAIPCVIFPQLVRE